MRWLVVVLPGLFITSISLAQESFRVDGSSAKASVIRNYFQENGHHYREEILIHESGYQDRLSLLVLAEPEWTIAKLNENALYVPGAGIVLKSEAFGKTLWTAANEWSEDWEKKFGEWIDTEVDRSFMVKHQLSTDCADAMIALRWIFARNHSLPAANTLSGGNLFTNESFRKEWANLKTHSQWDQDQRFRKALDYLLDGTYTHSLEKDAYPIKIDRMFFLAGTFNLSLHGSSGHTSIVHKVANSANDVPFLVYYSNLPKIVRELMVQVFYGGAPVDRRGGFMRMRWARKVKSKWSLAPRSDHVAFSEEQYDSDFVPKDGSFALAVFRRLFPNFSVVATVESLALSLQEQISARLKIVEDGYKHCSTANCAPGTQGYEDWSTPSRDKRIVEGLNTLYTFASLDATGQAHAISQKVLQAKVVDFDGKDFSIKDVVFAISQELADSDPRVEIDSRWGLLPRVAATKVAARAQAALLSREARINGAKAPCGINSYDPTRCRYLSDSWIGAATEAEDSELISLWSLRRDYCMNLPSLCPEFDVKLRSTNIAVGGTSSSAATWLERALWFVSDPSATLKQRWEGVRAEYNWINFEDACGVDVAKNGVARVQVCTSGGGSQPGPPGISFEGKSKIVEIDLASHSYREIFPGVSFEHVDLWPNGDLAVVRHNGKYKRIELPSGQELGGYQPELTECQYLSSNAKHVFCRTGDLSIRLSVRDWLTGAEKISLPSDGPFIGFGQDLDWVVVQQNQKWHFISWDANYQIVSNMALNSFLSLAESVVVDGDDVLEIQHGKLVKMKVPGGQKVLWASEQFFVFKQKGEKCFAARESGRIYFCRPESEQQSFFPVPNGKWMYVVRFDMARKITITELLDFSSGHARVAFQMQNMPVTTLLRGAQLRIGADLYWIDR